MDRNIGHVLYTRYNLKLSFQKTRLGDPVLTPIWLENRFKLFRDYCFSSLSQQSVTDFKWYIYFDTNTPENYLLEVKELTSEFSPLEIVTLNEEQEIVVDLNERIKTLDKNYIILTRIDNDDAFHFDFVKTIQSLLKPSEFKVLNLRCGYSYDMRAKVSFAQILESGPFFSVMEKVSDKNMIGLTLGSHMLIDHSESINYDDQALWCQIIHSQNVSNFNHGQMLFNNHHLRPFGIDPTAKGFLGILGFGIKHYLYTSTKARLRNIFISLYDKMHK